MHPYKAVPESQDVCTYGEDEVALDNVTNKGKHGTIRDHDNIYIYIYMATFRNDEGGIVDNYQNIVLCKDDETRISHYDESQVTMQLCLPKKGTYIIYLHTAMLDLRMAEPPDGSLIALVPKVLIGEVEGIVELDRGVGLLGDCLKVGLGGR